MPLVSVVIPVYNVERYLGECLDSILKQTLDDIEVICVDDGSNDNSLEILKDYADKDKRIIILQQDNQGAGVARNYGMSIAKGKYLSFLDSDDFFDTTLFQESVLEAERKDADIVIFKFRQYNNRTGKFESESSGFNGNFFTTDTFSCKDVKNNIFNLTNPAAWNKLYRRTFIEKNQLQFQDNKRTNDLFFTNAAMICAQNITLLDKVLVYYRIGIDSNSQSTNYVAPLDFYKALKGIKDFLDERNQFDDLKESFFELVVHVCRHNICRHNFVNRRNLYRTLRSEGYKKLKLDSVSIKRIERAKWYKIGNLFKF